jgi:hypothetical protein
MTDIATQICARLDSIAAERFRLDDEERRLRKALKALESTAEETSEAPGLDEKIQRCIVPISPSMAEQMKRLAGKAPPPPLSPMPYPRPHSPSVQTSDDWFRSDMVTITGDGAGPSCSAVGCFSFGPVADDFGAAVCDVVVSDPSAGHSSMPWLPMDHGCRHMSSVVTASDLNDYDA